jgi:2-polyprenyl-3-methyl-5-hydroxy-6-metoxy-1,4-benzoquinol methylase
MKPRANPKENRMDDSRDLNLERMMERIRLNVHNKRLADSAGAASAPTAADREAQLARHQDLVTLHSVYDLTSVSLDPQRRTLGRLMRATATFVGELLRPVIRRQAEYNAANTRLTDYLHGQIEQFAPQIAEIRAQTEGAIARNLEDFRALAQASARRFANLHADDIAMRSQALEEVSQRIAGLERRDTELREQFLRVEALERQQDEIRQELAHREASYTDALARLTQQTEALAQRLQRSEEVAKTIDRLRQSLEAQAHRLERTEAQCTAIPADIESHYAQVATQIESHYAQVASQIDTRYAELGTQFEVVRKALSDAQAHARHHYVEFVAARERLMHNERRLRRVMNPANGNGEPQGHHAPPAVVVPAAEIDYAGFEERLRSSEIVKDKQRIYVPYFAGKGPVLDVGCGRGEFLELMSAAGIEARGLDSDLDMVLQCKEKGLDVAQCDALQYLAGTPDDSLGGIFSAQVIEHLTTAQLSELISLAARKLRPGGLIILETLNPESLFVHYKWFWMDLSHVRLIHPQTLAFLLESAGLVEVSTNFTSPPDGVLPLPPLTAAGSESIEEFNRATEYLNQLLYGDQEYFIVARK